MDANQTVIENLKNHIGKDAILHLTSGEQINGEVKEVTTYGVILQKLIGKDFFDAYIVTSQITAISYKARE